MDDGEVSVFEYLDYRSYLADFYKRAKKTRRLSYRAFSQRAGLNAPNYLKLVIDGKRNLGTKTVTQFLKALKLEGDAARYFEVLVEFNQSEAPEDRAPLQAKVDAMRAVENMRKLEFAHSAYSSRWYLPAIRELAARKDFKNDPEWIADKLIPKIRPSEAREALKILLDLQLLEHGPQGKLRQGTPIVSTGPEVTAIHVANYHRMMILQATHAIESVPPEYRDISSLTLCVGTKGLQEIKTRLQSVRRELLEYAEAEPRPRQVVQINLQLFPLSGV